VGELSKPKFHISIPKVVLHLAQAFAQKKNKNEAGVQHH